jgi:formate hydrogenlyase transcriptional activator
LVSSSSRAHSAGSVFHIESPALRERQEDIPLLVWHFVKNYAQRVDKNILSVRDEDMKLLTHYSWPGNVRELQNIVECCVIQTVGVVLHRPSLPERIHSVNDASRKTRTLADAQREHILQTLQETNWVIGGLDGAAVALGVKRTTLLDMMRRLGISRPS